MTNEYHIDMSKKLRKCETVGVACFCPITDNHNGCALKGNLVKKVKDELYNLKPHEDQSKLYAIIIYLLIRDKLNDIGSLTICNDESFRHVKEHLVKCIGKDKLNFEIQNITSYRQKMGYWIQSPADNLANTYRRRALNKAKWGIGKKLNIIEINFDLIKNYW